MRNARSRAQRVLRVPAILAVCFGLAVVMFWVRALAEGPSDDGTPGLRVSAFGFFAANNVVVVGDSPPNAADAPAKKPFDPVDADTGKAVRKLLDDQVTAWNKGDLEAFMAGYWNSPELSFYSGRDVRRGWKETFERYKIRYQGENREMGKLAFDELTLDALSSDTVLVRGRWKLDMKAQTVDGLFSLVVKKVPEGWRIVHDHTSAGEPVAKPGR